MTLKLKREAGMYVLTDSRGDVVRVYRMGYAFALAARLLRAQGLRSRSNT